MIYLFTGDDSKTKRSEYEKFLDKFESKLETFFISRKEFNRTQIESFYSGSGLFFSKCRVVMNGMMENEETREFILEKLELLGASENIFVFLEGKLTKPVLDVFKKARTEMNVFELPKAKKEKFDNFLLANAFGAKDKLNLWIYFRQAVDRGVIMEELTGVLFWKIKDMILKRDFRKFTEAELKKSAQKLSYLLPEARRSGLDAETTFEQYLLEVF